MAYLATLDGVDLPEQFSYNPITPAKRFNVKRTTNAVVIQTATEIVDGDSLLAWECRNCCETEWQWFLGKADQDSNPNMPFTGYWGDVLTVKFHVFDAPDVTGRIFDLSGSFQVVAVTSWSS